MKYIASISTATLLAIGIVTVPYIKAEQAIAIGCDTYERVRGTITNCTSGTTEYGRELWLERYVVCLEQQLSTEIAVYYDKRGTYYAEWDQGTEAGMTIDNVAFQDEIVPPLTVNQNQSKAYRRNKDLCNN
ncbi:MAG: hypothetical protein AAF383_07030 [Cyanobacteria bacterium P01_A01_bin.83]